MIKIKAVPISLADANAFVDQNHRHHDPVHRDKYRVGAEVDGVLMGIVQVGRPVSRILDDGMTLEVVRLCTIGGENICSFLYSRAARIAKEMGYKRIITYILATETGTSLLASGWHKEVYTKGHSWSCKSRPRECTAPTCDKQRWEKDL